VSLHGVQAPPAPGIQIVQSDGSTDVTEGGATDTYQIVLATVPSSGVEVTITADAQTEVSLNGTTYGSVQVATLTSTAPQTVWVRAVDDAVDEGTQTSTISHAVTASGDPGYPVGPLPSITAHVTDNDTANITISDVSLAEGSPSGTTAFVFTVSLSNAVASNVTVDYATADGTATTADGDYTAASGTVTFTAGGALAQTVTVNVTRDSKPEGDETFFVNLSNARFGGATDATRAAITDGQGVGTILNDDAGMTVGVSVSPTSVAEDGTIYVGGSYPDDYLYAVNPDGSQKWACDIGSANR
jgi:hypothetical protein